MLYMNNPEALVAIAEEGRRELGMRTTVNPDHTPPGTADPEDTRPGPFLRLFTTRVAATG